MYNRITRWIDDHAIAILIVILIASILGVIVLVLIVGPGCQIEIAINMSTIKAHICIK